MNSIWDIVFLFVGIAVLVGVFWYMFRRDETVKKTRRAKNLKESQKSAAALAATRRFAALHRYEVIAPASLAKNGKYADLDFILVGWFGLLCVKCVGLGGEIYGSAGDAMWLQVEGEKRTPFENPLRVAESDTRLVRDTLFTANLKSISVETVCVFTNKKATLALPRGTGHYTLKEFKALLGKEKLLQDKRVDIAQTASAVKQWLVKE